MYYAMIVLYHTCIKISHVETSLKMFDVPLRPGFLWGKFDIYSESDVYYDRIEQPDPFIKCQTSVWTYDVIHFKNVLMFRCVLVFFEVNLKSSV